MIEPKEGEFWEVTAGAGTGHVIEIVRIGEKTAISEPGVIVKPLGGLASSETRIPMDHRWEVGMKRVTACPVCEQPLPGPHLGTCRYSMMNSGRPDLHEQKPTPIADRLNQIAAEVAELERRSGS